MVVGDVVTAEVVQLLHPLFGSPGYWGRCRAFCFKWQKAHQMKQNVFDCKTTKKTKKLINDKKTTVECHGLFGRQKTSFFGGPVMRQTTKQPCGDT